MLRNFILLLPSFVSLFWAVTLLCRWKTNYRSQKVSVLAFFLLSLSTYIWSIYFSGVKDYGLFYKLEALEGFTTLLLLPFFYFFFRSLISEQPFGWKEYIWLLPALLFGVGTTLLYWQMGESQAVAYIRETIENKGEVSTFTGPIFRIHHLLSVSIYTVLILVQIVYLLVYATNRIIIYRRRLTEFFSNMEGKSMDNNYVLLAGLYAILLLSLLTYKGRFHYDSNDPFVSFVMICWTVIIYFMGYNIYNLKYTADTFALDLEQADQEAIEQGYVYPQYTEFVGNDINEKANAAQHKFSDKYILLFNRLIEKDKIFLQSNLRLDDVARLMHTNRTYVSRLLNESYHTSFFDFINSKRIEYAQNLMRSNPQLTQEQIAEQSGFQHTSSFSRTFKQQTGMTFREWQRTSPLL